MPSREVPFPLFDADNHLYESEDAFTRYLPEEYRGAIEYVRVRRDDPELTHAAVHALNRWLDEVWSFNHRDRIYTAPVITLPIVEEAVKELEWCLEDDMAALADLLGIDRVLFGSDFPHPEGKADPITYVDEPAALPGDAKAKIMGGDLSRLIPA